MKQAPNLSVYTLAALVAALAALPAAAQDERRPGVTLYSDAQYQGRSATFYGDERRLSAVPFGQDVASSVQVDRGCVATLFAEEGYQGRATVLSESNSNLQGTDVGNDTVSSLRVDCSYGPPMEALIGAVRIYHDAGYRGDSQTFSGDDPDLDGDRVASDRASSVQVAPGCRVALYSDADYRGTVTVLESDVPDLGRTRVGNDTVSSLRVHCVDLAAWTTDRRPGEGVALYADTSFGGRNEELHGDDPDLGDNPIGNDTASSIRVPAGCEAVLWSDGGYRGRSTILRGDVGNLGETQVGNDQVSSIQVRCGMIYWP